MLFYWNDFDRALDHFDDFRRRVDRLFLDSEPLAILPDVAREGVLLPAWTSRSPGSFGGWPRARLEDGDQEIVLTAELPGVAQKDLNVSVHGDVLTVSGERHVAIPEGYKALLRERMPIRFTRTFALSGKVDVEHARAELKDGVLTLALPKAAESRPRQISVQAA